MTQAIIAIAVVFGLAIVASAFVVISEMVSHKRMKASISIPAPPGTRGPFLTQTYTVKIQIPEGMRFSDLFLSGIYEDLSNFVGIKTMNRPVNPPRGDYDR